MKKIDPGSKENNGPPHSNPFPSKGRKRGQGHFFLFLFLALTCFGFDLYHFAHHLHHNPSLIHLPGVPLKLGLKILLFLLPFFLILFQKRFFLALMGLLIAIPPAPVFAAASPETCRRAQKLMKDSGVARDAKEGFFGKITIKPPRRTFPSEMDKVTWWGIFEPFEFWGTPEFEAIWINPRGQVVKQQTFRTGKCVLAKTTLNVHNLPTGRLEPGMWRVVINCADVIIDNHPFAVIGSSTASPDSTTVENQQVMIWADDVR